jgi:GNAT superfamily N-acetyltransferase
MAAPRIRLASLADASGIAEIRRGSFIEYEASYTPAAFAATVITSTEVCRRIGEGPVWVAGSQDVLVGTIAAVRRADELYVRGMAVLPSARSAHVGRSLLAEAEHFGRTHGLRRLVLSTTPFLTRAIRLYEDSGVLRANEDPQNLFGTPLFTMTKSLTSGAGVEEMDSAARIRRRSTTRGGR